MFVEYVYLYLFIYLFIQQVLISYLFYTYYCICVNPNLPVHPTITPQCIYRIMFQKK